jgi:hypothetical protein
MKDPEEVRPANFRKHIVIYNDQHFSVAYGQHVDGGYHIAMRWNGDDADPNDVGYPKTFGNPVWFFLPNYGNWVFEMLQAMDRIEPRQRILDLNARLEAMEE